MSLGGKGLIYFHCINFFPPIFFFVFRVQQSHTDPYMVHTVAASLSNKAFS
jgi:hypothetical protein